MRVLLPRGALAIALHAALCWPPAPAIARATWVATEGDAPAAEEKAADRAAGGAADETEGNGEERAEDEAPGPGEVEPDGAAADGVEGGAAGETGAEEAAAAAQGGPVRPPLPTRLSPIERPLVEPGKRTLRVTTDEECELSIDGEPIQRLAAGESIDIELKGGLRKFSARSVETSKAVWEKEVVVREGGREAVSIRLAREIRAVRRSERHEAVLRRADDRLMWAKRDNARDVRWDEAAKYCAESRLGGFEDWRLPTMAELGTLEAIWSRGLYKVSGVALSGCCPWSSDLIGADRAWNFNFTYRKPFESHRSYSLGYRALCVREWDPAAEESGEEDEGDEGPDAVEEGQGGEDPEDDPGSV